MNIKIVTFTDPGRVPRRLRLNLIEHRGRWCVDIVDGGPAMNWPVDRHPRAWAAMSASPAEAMSRTLEWVQHTNSDPSDWRVVEGN